MSKGGLVFSCGWKDSGGRFGPSAPQVSREADCYASLGKSSPHADPGVECSFNLRYGPASGFPNVEEGSEGAETEAFIVLEEKEEPPHFSGISILWAIHTKGGECPASPSQEW